ncbi:DUF4494 family protein [Spirosoma sp.]|uniref:DUF4494 family protein n=1 Tax=Spirosoma sp. TaxID=1899569 RepID=UPI00261CC861|nr:DUF4494 family protein [Spirosoma sp.]MCX6217685.1 DUF4494 family protein [Spirosoma sp.]
MWFLSKIRYSVQDSLGKFKAISEQFVHDAISYGDVEAQLAEVLKGRVDDYTYDLSKIRFDSVYEPHVKGAFFKVQYEEKTTTEAGVEKVTVKSHLVVAQDVPDAEKKASEYMKNWITDWTIIGADKTKILGVWHPLNQDWKDDFIARMADLAAAGNETGEPAPTTIFNADGTAKKIAFGDDDLIDEEHAQIGSYADARAEVDAMTPTSGFTIGDDSALADTLKSTLDEFGASEVSVTAEKNGKVTAKATMKKSAKGKLTFQSALGKE